MRDLTWAEFVALHEYVAAHARWPEYFAPRPVLSIPARDDRSGYAEYLLTGRYPVPDSVAARCAAETETAWRTRADPLWMIRT